jgi:hypothetical protein
LGNKFDQETKKAEKEEKEEVIDPLFHDAVEKFNSDLSTWIEVTNKP